MEENMEVETPEEGSEGGVVTAETGAEAEETAGEKKQEAAEPARQSREENARYQAARKAGESAGFRRAEERYQSALAKLGLPSAISCGCSSRTRQTAPTWSRCSTGTSAR